MLKKHCPVIDIDLGMPVFSHGSGGDLATEEIVHKLCAVADAEYRDAELEDLFIAAGRIVVAYITRTTGEDDALRVHFADLLDRHVIRMDFAVDV